MKKIIIFALIVALILLPGCAFTPDEPAPFTSIKGRTGDETYQPIEIDTNTRSLIIIDLPHHKIHEGSGFKADIVSDDIDSEGNNNALHITFTTANTTKLIHLVVSAVATGSADISLVEAPTGGVVGGSNLEILNRNRNSVETSGIISTDDTAVNEMTQDATAPTGGTELHHWKLGAGNNKIGGQLRETEEFILMPATTYSIRLTANANAIRGQLALDWYEHISLDP